MSTSSAKANVIDADAHVVETERVWDYLEATEKKYRPTLVSAAPVIVSGAYSRIGAAIEEST